MGLLTDPPSPVEAAITAARAEQFAKAQLLAVRGFLAGYRDGDVTFEGMCRGVAAVSAGLSDVTRDAMLGSIAREALALPAPARRSRKGLPWALRELVIQVTDLVAAQEALGRVKNGVLFERVAGIFTEARVPLSGSQVYRLYYPD